MLQPPSLPQDEKPPNEALVITDQLIDQSGWKRVVTFWYDGEDYQYVLEVAPTIPLYSQPTEAEARRKLYGPTVEGDIRMTFLREVHLDTSRPH